MNDSSGFFVAPGVEDLTRTAHLALLYESSAGYAQIWRGVKAGKFIAYKALKPEFRGQMLYEKLLRKDFNIGYTLDHPNVCRYYGFCELPELGNAIEMEWIDGTTLEEYSRDARPTAHERRRIVSEICAALSYIHHRHVIHRDIKPSNILVTNNGGFVKIIDFGLSDSDSYATLKASAGTAAYAAPELKLDGAAVDSRADIWSLGKVISEFAPEYKSIARRCMAAEPARRYENAERVLKAVVARSSRRPAFIVAVAVVLIAAAYVAIAGLRPTQNNAARGDVDGGGGETTITSVACPDTAVVAAPAEKRAEPELSPVETPKKTSSAETSSDPEASPTETPTKVAPKVSPAREITATTPKREAEIAKPATTEEIKPVQEEQEKEEKPTLTQDDLDAIFRQATSAMEEGTK